MKEGMAAKHKAQLIHLLIDFYENMGGIYLVLKPNELSKIY